MRNRIFFVTMLMLLALSFSAKAQDIHFSEFYETGIINNPALTGIFSEDYKVTCLYRTQWATVATPYKTGLLSAESKIKLNSVNDYLSFGVLAYYDNSGTVNFKTTTIYPAINYNKSLEDKFGSYINVGFTGGYVQRSIDVSKMTFDNQWVNGVFVPSAGSGEPNSFNPNLQNYDLGAGLSFSSSIDEANKLNYFLGAAYYHMLGMKTSMLNDNTVDNLAAKISGNFGVHYIINESINARYYLNYMMQGAYREIITGALVKWNKLDQFNHQPFALSGGLFYRVNDAIIPMIRLDYKGNALSIAYDVNISSLQSASSMKGAFEISLTRLGVFNMGVDDKHLCPRF